MEFPVKELPSMDISKFLFDPEERVWNGPFTFVQGSDTQLGMIDQYHLKKTEPNWDKEVKLTKESVTRINAMDPKPRFYIICGDMLDSFPYEGKLRELREKQYKDFVPIFRDLDPEVKLVCVCGNHDIGDIPTKGTLEVYRAQFGQDVFSFWVGGVKFVVLNSQYFKAPDAIPEETARQLAFLDTISDPNAKHIVVFQHIPYFTEDPSEPTHEYFNLDKETRLDLLSRLRDSGVKYVFCGHYHRNAGGFYKDMEIVVTSAVGAPMGQDPSGFRIVNVDEQAISHEYIPFRKTPSVDEI